MDEQYHAYRRAHELLIQVEASARSVIADELKRRGIEPGSIPAQAAQAVGDLLVDSWGGQQIYFPKDRGRRNCQIYEEFDGYNQAELGAKYNLSTQAIYKILAAERASRALKQGSLMDFMTAAACDEGGRHVI